jgi:hypothetical protein
VDSEDELVIHKEFKMKNIFRLFSLSKKYADGTLSVILTVSLLSGIILFWLGFLGSSDNVLKFALGSLIIATVSAIFLVSLRKCQKVTPNKTPL